jgi:hypothetical protein
MKLSKVMFAVAAVACGSAMAATPVGNIGISSGASASKGNLKLSLTNRCAATLAEYRDGTNNVSTYVCATGTFSATPNAAEYAASTAVNFTGTSIAELRLNVGGGSFTAVCLLAGWPAGTKCPVADTYVDPASSSPNTAGARTAPPVGSVVLGGLLDLEPNGFLGSVRTGIANPGSTVSAAFAQTFGVAASADLWNTMQADQIAAGKLPASCGGNTADAECTPVIGKAQMSSIMAANPGNDAYSRGANFLAPSLAVGTNLKYLRRVDTSGTQAVAQQYFLGNVCSPAANIGVVDEGGAAGTAVTPALTVYGLGSTGNVRTLLNAASPNYAIGIMSAENNQAESWRWLRVGGMNAADRAAPGTAGVSNTATAIDGRYDFWFLSRIAQPASTGIPASFWASVRTGFAAVPAGTTPGLFAATETKFTKGSANSCQPAVSN